MLEDTIVDKYREVSANLCDGTTVFSFIAFEQTVGKIKDSICYLVGRASKEYGTTLFCTCVAHKLTVGEITIATFHIHSTTVV